MFIPLNNNILVEIEKKENKTASGIYLPDSASKENTKVGVVVAVAQECNMVNKGNKVMFNAFSGVPVMVEGKEYLLINKLDVMGMFVGK